MDAGGNGSARGVGYLMKYLHPGFVDVDHPAFGAPARASFGEKSENLPRPTLLLHCCCAPCAAGAVERLVNVFELTFYYYNPNITEKEEYLKRFHELERLGEHFSVPVIDGGDGEDFFEAVEGSENEPEGGKRCKVCFEMRLKKTAELAREYDYFATTLTLSPLKNARLINEIGERAGEAVGSEYLKTDFKKRGGVLRSKALSEELELYRQDYCGCVFSKRRL